jgi:hypothetical protein
MWKVSPLVKEPINNYHGYVKWQGSLNEKTIVYGYTIIFGLKINQLHKEPSHLEFEKLVKLDRLFISQNIQKKSEGFMIFIFFLIPKIWRLFKKWNNHTTLM